MSMENEDLSEDEIKISGWIKNALEKSSFEASPLMADKIIARIASKRSVFLSDHFWIFIGVAAFLIVAIGVGFFLNFQLDLGAFRFMSAHTGLLVFGIALVLALHFIDRKLLRPGNPKQAGI